MHTTTKVVADLAFNILHHILHTTNTLPRASHLITAAGEDGMDSRTLTKVLLCKATRQINRPTIRINSHLDTIKISHIPLNLAFRITPTEEVTVASVEVTLMDRIDGHRALARMLHLEHKAAAVAVLHPHNFQICRGRQPLGHGVVVQPLRRHARYLHRQRPGSLQPSMLMTTHSALPKICA